MKIFACLGVCLLVSHGTRVIKKVERSKVDYVKEIKHVSGYERTFEWVV